MKFSCLFVALVALHFSTIAAAEQGPGCAAKQAGIESKLTAAQSRGNKNEMAGLNKALRATKANCTEESLAKEHEAEIRKAQRELTKREKELAEAEKNGDPAKLAKRRAKTEQARRELADAQKSIVK